MSSGNNTIGEVYRSVIDDVINQVKEAFLDENIDVEILSQLKNDWRDKVKQSGYVDLDATSISAAAVAPPPQRQNIAPPPMRANSQVNRVPVQPQVRAQPRQINFNNPMQDNHAIRAQFSQPNNQVGISVGQQGLGQLPQQLGQIPILSAQQYVTLNQQQQPHVVIMPNVQQQQQIQMALSGQGFQTQRLLQAQQIPQHQQQSQLNHMNQLDGGLMCTNEPKKKKKNKSKKEAMKVLASIMRQMQLDGGGGGMSDSSSEDEPEEDDDPLKRIADQIGNGEVEDGDQNAEEDPLNSDDDQSDDEDSKDLFDAENIVMCQFEKVNRARTKWKFQLKDGIMHIEKKDYCFQKCTGEAEW